MLYREVVDDDVKRLYFRHSRIKVLTDEGRSYGDVQIPFADKVNPVQDLRARVIQPDGRIVDFNGEVFDRVVIKANKLKIQAKTFTLPEVRTGSVVEYSYTTHERWKPPDLIKHPDNYLIFGTDSMQVIHWSIPDELFIHRSRFTFRPLPTAKVVWTTNGVTKENGPVQQPDGSYVMEAENIRGFPEEEFMPPDEMLKPCVDFFYVVGYFRDPGDFWATYMQQYIDDIERWLGQPKAVVRLVDQTISTSDTPETKLRKLYARAQRFVYLDSERQTTGGEPSKRTNNIGDLVKRGSGSGNQINLLFIALARAAGFSAAPVLLTTRDRGRFRANLMDPDQLNGMVSWVQAGSKEYYLDPATPYCPFALLPWEETDARGYQAERPSGTLVTTPPPDSADAVIERKGAFELDTDGDLDGHVTVIFSGQEALHRRRTNADKDDSNRRKALVDEVRGWLPADSLVELSDISKWDQSSEPLRAEFTIKIPSYAGSTGHRLLLAPGIFQTNNKSLLQSGIRTQPIYFPYPHRQVDEIEIHLPDDRDVESLPEARTQVTSFGRYETSYFRHGKTLRLIRKMQMDGYIFRPEAYSVIRNFFEKARAGDEQQIILQKTVLTNAPDLE